MKLCCPSMQRLKAEGTSKIAQPLHSLAQRLLVGWNEYGTASGFSFFKPNRAKKSLKFECQAMKLVAGTMSSYGEIKAFLAYLC